jgi:4-hydroxybenzoyl-CoA reductase subunit alpha
VLSKLETVYDRESLEVVGHRIPRLDGIEKVTGTAQYTTDIQLPKMLYGQTLKSPHPHAIIKSIDISEAQNLPGVVCVITGRDIPNNNRVMGLTVSDQSILAADRVRFVGDEIAAVAAIDERTAEKAISKIKVEYEPLSAVFSVDKAMAKDAILVQDFAKSNIGSSRQVVAQDAEKGFAEADVIVEDTFLTTPIEHAPLETEAAVSSYDGSSLKVWTTTQVPYWDRVVLSRMLGIPQHRVRVITPHVGGGFGGRDLVLLLYICAALAWRVGGNRPVRMVRTREEEFTCSTHRHSMQIRIKLGAKKDGLLTAMQGRALIDAGAFVGWADALGQAQGHLFASRYKCENVKWEHFTVYTNNTPGGPMRGFGNGELSFALESTMDRLAHELKMDPIGLRRMNIVKQGYITPIGWNLKGCHLDECVDKVSEYFRAKRLELRQDDQNSRFRRGLGFACGSHWCGWRPGYNAHIWRTGFANPEELYAANPGSTYVVVGKNGQVQWRQGFESELIDADPSSCILNVSDDGTATVHIGEVDMGQGLYTTIAMIVSEETGIKLEDINVVGGDTHSGAFGIGTFASRSTFIAGNAALKAAKQVKRILLELASEMLNVPADQLKAANGKISLRDNPEKSVFIADVAFRAYATRRGGGIMVSSFHDPDSVLPDASGKGSIAEAYLFFAQGVEVEVDTETGIVKVLEVVSCHDVGKVINPIEAEGQVQGSVHQGIGHALTEEVVREKGRISNPNFLNYVIPPSTQMPKIKIMFVEKPESSGPLGAKGIGEPAMVGIAPAIANAIYDAVGVRMKTLPMGPEKVLAELRNRGSSKKD